jgi:putative colanic acid biosynthesis UDP-glucose lipid carrier transferase
MNAPVQKQASRLRGSLTLAGAIEALLDPVTILLWLVAMSAWFYHDIDKALDVRLVVAAVLAFALTYPGNVALTDTTTTLIGKCLVTAVTVLAGLALFGYASAWLRDVARRELLPWFAALPILLFLAHIAARAALPRVFALSDVQATVVVCGVNDIGAGLARQFQTNPYHGLRFIGYFDDREPKRLTQIGDQPLLGNFRELGDFARLHRVDRIYLALPMATQPRILSMLDDLKDSTASIYFAPDIFVTDLINGRIEAVAGMPVVAVRETPFAGVNGLIKRIEDILLSGIVLVMISPILAAIAIGVRLSSPGPALFKQRRYGLDGREIIVYKFRSMTVAEDGASTFTAAKKGDQRITRFGHFLRRSSLDELPQVINVLFGTMSLVGPRPHAVLMNEQFRKLIPGYMLRHKVKPGITGLAQVRGFRGGDDLDEMTKRIASDLEYLRNWTLSLDLVILMRTALVVFGDKKAF